MSLFSLLRFVRSHDCSADAVIENGAIYATASYILAGNVPFKQWERVGATLVGEEMNDGAALLAEKIAKSGAASELARRQQGFDFFSTQEMANQS